MNSCNVYRGDRKKVIPGFWDLLMVVVAIWALSGCSDLQWLMLHRPAESLVSCSH